MTAPRPASPPPVAAPEQAVAPYLEAIQAFAARDPVRFHVPGHKGGPGADPALRAALGAALALDVPQDLEGIDLGPEPTPYQRAEELAAEAYGASRTWLLTNGATQGNHALALAIAPLGAEVVVQRNSHASLVDGLVLSGGRPTFVAPEYDDELGMAHGVEPAVLADALAAAPGARAAFVVSPTYYGMAADVPGLVEVAHAAGAALVVDGSWGPHFGFHPGVPPSALAAGADAVLTSTHKIVGSLTQSAMLHLGPESRVDTGAVARAVRLTRSTSPSALLYASLDAARRQLAIDGERLLAASIAAAGAARGRVSAIPGCAAVGDGMPGRPGIAAVDPLRLVVDVRGTGRTGYELAAAVRDDADVHLELATHATMVSILGLAQPPGPLHRLTEALARAVARMSRPGRSRPLTRSAAAFVNEMVITPRDAFLGESEPVPVEEAPGRVSCEAIAGYPPGIPALLPGERITAEVIAYLRELTEAGARLHGASDPGFDTVRVLRA